MSALAAGVAMFVLPAAAQAAAPIVSMKVSEASPTAVAINGTYAGQLIVKNESAGAVNDAEVSLGVSGDASMFSVVDAAHPFSPALTITSGCTSVSGGYCTLGTLAAGETRTVGISVGGLTHYGKFSISAWGSYSYLDGATTHYAGMTDDNSYETSTVHVTNGKSAVVSIAGYAPDAVTSRTNVAVNGEFANNGPDAIDQGVMLFEASAFDSKGEYWYGSGTPASSIVSLKLANGTVCAPWTAPGTTVAQVNTWSCALNNIAPHARIAFDAVVNFPTDRRDASAWVSGSVVSTADLAAGSTTQFWRTMDLNPRHTVDLKTTISTQAMIGANRSARMTVTVANAGNSTAEGVSLGGDATSGLGGTFRKDTLPGSCSSLVNRSAYVRCGMGNIPAGQSRTVVIDVVAGKKLGMFGVVLGASSGGTEINPDDNTDGIIYTIVKPNAVPFLGVKIDKIKKAKLKAAAFLKSGNVAKVTCPVKCKAIVQLQVKRSIAEKLGLVKKAKARKGKKPLPFVIIGSASKGSAANGVATVKVKIKKGYAKKVGAIKTPLALSRVITVISTDPFTKNASTVKTSKLTLTPGKAAKKKKH